MIKRYCRGILLVTLLFCVSSLFGEVNSFLIYYPCLMMAFIPINLIAHEELEKWNLYCQTLPLSKTQIVTEKYFLGLLGGIAVLSVMAVSGAVRQGGSVSGVMQECLMRLAAGLAVNCLVSSLLLPFVFRYGAEKGRTLVMIVTMIVAVGLVVLEDFIAALSVWISSQLKGVWIVPGICLAVIVCYLFSWRLSIVFYKRREI